MRLRFNPSTLSAEDPNFGFLVGRMVGACEMAATLLQNTELTKDELARIGAQLHGTARRFLVEEDDAKPALPAPGRGV